MSGLGIPENPSIPPPAVEMPQVANATPLSGDALTFRRNEFVRSVGTGDTLDAKGNKVTTAREVIIPAEMVRDYSDFLGNHLTNIRSAVDRKTLKLSTLPKNERALLGALTDPKDGTINQAAVDAFLRTPDGFKAVSMMIEQQAALVHFALGLEVARDPVAARDAIITGGQFTLDKGVSRMDVIDKMLREKFGPRYATVLKVGGVTALAAVAAQPGLLGVVGKVAAGVGGASGVATKLGELNTKINEEIKPKVDIKTEQSIHALNTIKGNADLSAYVLATTGIDVGHYVVVGGEIQESHRSPVGGVQDLQRLASEAAQLMSLRREFYSALSIPSSRIDAMPEQFLFDYRLGDNPEQTSLLYQEDVMREFKPNTGGIQYLRLGPGRFLLDDAGNRRRYIDARRKVMGDYIGRALKTVVEKPEKKDRRKPVDLEGATALVDARIAHIAEGGKFVADLEKRKAELAVSSEAVLAYEQAQAQLDGLQEQLEIEFPGVSDIDTEITRLKNDTTSPDSLKSLRAQVLATQQLKAQFIDTAANNLPPKLDPKTLAQRFDIIREQASEKFDDEIAEIKSQVVEAQTRIARLEEIKRQQRENAKKIAEQRDKIVGAITIDSSAILADHAELTGWGLSNGELANMDVEIILQKINSLHAVNPTYGWDVAQNRNPAMREKVRRAMTEARSVTREALDSQRATFEPDFNAVMGHGLPQIDVKYLATTPTVQIQMLLTSNGINATPVEIKNASEWAKIKYVNRASISVDTEIQDIDNLKKLVGKDDEARIGTLKVIHSIMERQGSVLGKEQEVVDYIDTYTSSEPVTATTAGLTDAERAPYFDPGNKTPLQLSEGALEWYQLVTGYQNDPQNPDRNKMFQEVLTILPPREIARILNETLELKVAEQTTVAGGAVTVVSTDVFMKNVFDRLNRRAKKGSIGRAEISKAVLEMMGHVKDKSVELTT